MKEFEQRIVEKLKKIDNNWANMEKDEIDQIIDEARQIADKNNSEKWEIFLKSEKAYYDDDLELALELNKIACEMDKEESKKDGTQENYYMITSLAVSYDALGDESSAIDFYTKAIDLNENDLQARLYRSLVYRDIKKYEKARQDIEYILVQEKSGELYVQAQQAMGRLYIELGKYDEAINILENIYDMGKEDAEYLDALALTYIYKQNYKDAEKTYLEAIRVCKDPEFIKYLQIKLNYLESFHGDYEENPSGNLILGLSSENKKIIERVDRNIKNETTILKKYKEEYALETKRREKWKNENYITCLKGWSSSTPELSLGGLDSKFKRGGGFFIHYNGIGIVIDPGINFFENLHEQKLFIQDIDVVIVTHNHIDHNNDLSKILDVSYQINRDIIYYIDKNTYRDNCNVLEQVEKRDRKFVNKIYPDAAKKEEAFSIKNENENPVEVGFSICPTEHGCEGSFGLKLRLGDVMVGYTSDTKYNESIGEFFEDCDIIIANISETNINDMTLKELKKNHLGIFGVYHILRRIQDKEVVCLLTEFWGGQGDIRIEMAETLTGYLRKDNVDILPVDIGMTHFFDEKSFLCNSCGEKTTKTERSVVRVGKEEDKKLLCLCSGCCYIPKMKV